MMSIRVVHIYCSGWFKLLWFLLTSLSLNFFVHIPEFRIGRKNYYIWQSLAVFELIITIQSQQKILEYSRILFIINFVRHPSLAILVNMFFIRSATSPEQYIRMTESIGYYIPTTLVNLVCYHCVLLLVQTYITNTKTLFDI